MVNSLELEQILFQDLRVSRQRRSTKAAHSFIRVKPQLYKPGGR